MIKIWVYTLSWERKKKRIYTFSNYLIFLAQVSLQNFGSFRTKEKCKNSVLMTSKKSNFYSRLFTPLFLPLLHSFPLDSISSSMYPLLPFPNSQLYPEFEQTSIIRNKETKKQQQHSYCLLCNMWPQKSMR